MTAIKQRVLETFAIREFIFWLLSALLEIERGNYARALESATRAERSLSLVVPELRTERAVLVQIFAGVAEARSGNLEAAQNYLDRLKTLDGELGNWLEGEIALASGDLSAAEAAFAKGELGRKMAMDRGPQRALGSGLPFRDGPARLKKARGDFLGAIELYRRLNTPENGHNWSAIFEPRYVLETARLLDQIGDEEAARAEYERFVDL